MTIIRTKKEVLNDFNNCLRMLREDLTIIRKNLKYISDDRLQNEYYSFQDGFNQIDVFRQHLEYLEFTAKQKEKNVRK